MSTIPTSGQLITEVTTSGLVQGFLAVMPTKYTRETDSVLYNFLNGFGEVTGLNVDQINELYNKSIISRACSGDLDVLINERSKIRRKNDENDADFFSRYKRWVYDYNITRAGVTQIVEDIYGEEPQRIIEWSDRNAYWADFNVTGSVSSSGIAYYDDDLENAAFWGNVPPEDAFTAWIILRNRPQDEILEDLITVLTCKMITGTNIYIVFPLNGEYQYDMAESMYDTITTYV